jgi:hypothetical protein
MGRNNMGIMNLSGLGLCMIAIVMLMAAFSKKKSKAFKARRAEKRGL